MKFILFLQLCLFVNNECMEPFNTNLKFDSFKECSIAGYQIILQEATNISEKDYNKFRPAFIFNCIEQFNESKTN